MLKLVDIKKEYVVADSCVIALKGINLEFRRNEFVSILGQSGCGKTTLLNIIGGLDKYTSGDLEIEGISTKEFKDADWDSYRNHKVGFVFQSYNLISHLNVLNNVELALTISGVSSAERKQRAIEALEKVGLKDQIHKMPNQLSGGQMQRVAIARAIINNPEILLADEPTGALDTETSVQIMDLIKEISKERLVIMVTHNPELAESYSSRIVKLLDGRVVEDSNPYSALEEEKKAKKTKKSKTKQAELKDENATLTINPEEMQNDEVGKTSKKKKKEKKTKNSPFTKTSMSFWTALSLSFKNLLSKKGRTMLVSIASSIGIIGVSLVLALSNGFNAYIAKLQADMLSTYPLTISNSSVNTDAVAELLKETELDKYPAIEEIITNKVAQKLSNITKNGTITEEFVTGAIDTIDPELYYGITKETGQYLNVYTFNNRYKNSSKPYTYVEINNSNGLGMLGGDTKWQLLVDNKDFVLSQYDVIGGVYPTTANQILLVVDEYNRLADVALENLGFNSTSKDNVKFEEMIGKKFYALPNDSYYITPPNPNQAYGALGKFITEGGLDKANSIELEISGILRKKLDTQNTLYSPGIVFSTAVLDQMLEKNATSDIVTFAKNNPIINPFTGEIYTGTVDEATKEKENVLRKLGGIAVPNNISIYAKDFDTKVAIKEHIDNYNKNIPEDKRVNYTDLMEMFMSALTTLVDIISYVLLAFSAISLLVSSIMIAVITYVSVIERTKEIGILRSIGARKKDISRVFNAETFMIGLLSGLIGVVVAWLLTIPINLIISAVAGGAISSIAILTPLTALIMVLISVGLTMLAGLIPSRMASKKDPITCLRTE